MRIALNFFCLDFGDSWSAIFQIELFLILWWKTQEKEEEEEEEGD